ncbi:MAG: 3D domain-containing protein [Planctomycetota bacterium]
MFIYALSQIRGSRRTQPFAYALAGIVLTGTAVVAGTLVLGVVKGMNQGESLGLMKIDPAAISSPADLDPALVAPSRSAPVVMRIQQETAPPRSLHNVSTSELATATADGGPKLGQESPLPAINVLNAPTFDGRPLRPVKTVRMLTTAYSPDEQSCGIWADGITASGYSVWTNGMKLVAADTKLLPFGTIITVPGYNGGRPVPVLDRGGAIKGHRLDVLYPTHERALQWGAQRLDVTVWEYADE